MSGARRLSLGDHLAISCFWLAYNFHWGALLGIGQLVGQRHTLDGSGQQRAGAAGDQAQT